MQGLRKWQGKIHVLFIIGLVVLTGIMYVQCAAEPGSGIAGHDWPSKSNPGDLELKITLGEGIEASEDKPLRVILYTGTNLTGVNFPTNLTAAAEDVTTNVPGVIDSRLITNHSPD
jgi:hypothetical protein